MSSRITYPRSTLAIISLHAVSWIIYGAFIYAANAITNPNVSVVKTIFFLLPLCLTFYCCVWCLQKSDPNRIFFTIGIWLALVIILALLTYFYIYALLPKAGIKIYSTTAINVYLKSALLGFFQYLFYAAMYTYIRIAFKQQRQMAKMEEEKLLKELENARLKEQEMKIEQERLKLEYAFMRSQINPHFLHNTLNLLYAQAFEHSDELAKNIQHLSRMMSYSMECTKYQSDKVFVQKEINNLKTLIEINNLRFNDKKIIDLEIEGEATNQMVPPLSFLTIVENAIKHGDYNDDKNQIQIVIRITNDTVQFQCRNKKKQTKQDMSSHGIGLTNLQKRLSATFDNPYALCVTDDEFFYTCELLIKSNI